MPLPGAPPDPPPDGRSLAWRVGMLLVAALLAAAGVGLVLWPQALAWAVAGVLAVGALLFLASALFAKGRR